MWSPWKNWRTNLRVSTKMAADNEQKLDELSNKIDVKKDELKRAIERAELAQNMLKSMEEITPNLIVFIKRRVLGCLTCISVIENHSSLVQTAF